MKLKNRTKKKGKRKEFLKKKNKQTRQKVRGDQRINVKSQKKRNQGIRCGTRDNIKMKINAKGGATKRKK